jgi:hypothetical protein
MKAIVYITTNLVNGKKYIGSTNGGNKYYIGGGKYFAKAVKKYGCQNFIKQTLWEGPAEYRYEMEEYYIDYYGAATSNLFYNVSDKGIGLPNRIVTDEQKAKISAANKGKPKPPRTKEHSAKIGAANKGKKFTDEHKAKLSAAKQKNKK